MSWYKKKITAKDYISQKEYDEALRLYYNGLDFTNAIVYKEKLVDKLKLSAKAIEPYLIEGEDYDNLFVNNYAITTYGRVMSLRYEKWLKPKFYNSNIYYYANHLNFNLQKEFDFRGWHYDKIDILKMFIDNNWNHVIHENCKYATNI